MKSSSGTIKFLTRGEGLAAEARTGVSLHCHTMHSKELLDFVPYYAKRIPVVSAIWRRQMDTRRRLYGREPDFTSGFWQPPLTGPLVVESERSSITNLGLSPLVSITDHDTIDANVELLDTPEFSRSPISMEWTVPFMNAFFHFGIHNLPKHRAEVLSGLLLDYTFAEGPPNLSRLDDLLTLLNDIPQVLIVFNHPIWDIEMIGQAEHERALAMFLSRFAIRVHALEINGFRSRSENEAVAKLAESLNLPIVSGGDRHCCQPNTMINITDAGSFDEFVDEVRIERRSRIAVTPEYHVPLPSRQLASIAQILSDYASFPEGRKTWPERVFLDGHDGLGVRPLLDHWNGRRPLWTHAAVGAVRLMAHPLLRPIIGLTVGDADIGREDNRPQNATAKSAHASASQSPFRLRAAG